MLFRVVTGFLGAFSQGPDERRYRPNAFDAEVEQYQPTRQHRMGLHESRSRDWSGQGRSANSGQDTGWEMRMVEFLANDLIPMLLVTGVGIAILLWALAK